MNASFSCPRCGAAITTDARFCQSCGQQLLQADASVPPPGQYLPPPGQYAPPPAGSPPPYYVQQQQEYQRQQAKSNSTAVRIVIWVLVLFLGLPVLGIVAAVAIPLLFSARNNAVNEKARNCLRTVVSAEAAYYAAHQVYGSFADLEAGSQPFLDSRFSTNNLGNGIRISEEPKGGGQTYTCTIETDMTSYTATESGEIVQN